MTIPLVADGFGLDRALAAMFLGAKQGETVSLMSARAQAAGRRWGCVLCRFLDLAVQRGHCALTLAGDPTPRPAAYRAGAWLFAAVAVPWLASLLLLLQLLRVIHAI